jgi:hypothetical protein
VTSTDTLQTRPGEGLADARALSEAIFGGELVVFSDIAAMRDIVECSRQIVETYFGAEPEAAEAAMAPEAFRKAALAARKTAARDAGIDMLWRAALSQIGYPVDDLLLDRMLLRVAPSRDEVRGRFARPLPAHRDSWGSAIMSQVNWWAPLYELAETRTMVIWPEAFDTPVANTSGEWDYEALLARKQPDYPLLPETRETPARPGLPVAIEPGQLLAFSAAHLHASVSDRSGRTRFSLDTRTVWQADVDAGRGAPNVDGAPAEPRWDMFERPARAAEQDLKSGEMR